MDVCRLVCDTFLIRAKYPTHLKLRPFQQLNNEQDTEDVNKQTLT